MIIIKLLLLSSVFSQGALERYFVSVSERDDESTRKLVNQRVSQAFHFSKIVSGAYCVFHHAVFGVCIDVLESMEEIAIYILRLCCSGYLNFENGFPFKNCPLWGSCHLREF